MTLLLVLPHLLASMLISGLSAGRYGAVTVVCCLAVCVAWAGFTGLSGASECVSLRLDVASLDSVDVSLLLALDSPTLMMVWLLTGASWTIFLYLHWYLWDSPRLTQFLGWMMLFTGSMQLLLVSSDALLLFAAWEGIGAASMLLISFFARRADALRSGVKAVVYNRIGDIGLLASLMSLSSVYGSTWIAVWDTVVEIPIDRSPAVYSSIGVVLAASAKSASYGLHSWLLDAMEGPTPVSALLHSATLVTAGVWVLLKLSSVWIPGSTTSLWLSTIGLVTILAASLAACGAWDLKRSVAYSTMAHMGVGFLILGTGVESSSALCTSHLITHGWSKSLLFLVVGCAIHDARSQDLRGGISYISSPVLSCVAAICLLSVIGLPGTAIGSTKDAALDAIGFAVGSPSLSLGLLAVVALAHGYGLGMFYLTWRSMHTAVTTSSHSASHSTTLVLCIAALHTIILPSVAGDLLCPSLMPELIELSPRLLSIGFIDPTVLILATGLGSGAFIVNTSKDAATRRSPSLIYRTMLNRLWVDRLFNELATRTSSSLIALQVHLEQGLFQSMSPVLYQRHVLPTSTLVSPASFVGALGCIGTACLCSLSPRSKSINRISHCVAFKGTIDHERVRGNPYVLSLYQQRKEQYQQKQGSASNVRTAIARTELLPQVK